MSTGPGRSPGEGVRGARVHLAIGVNEREDDRPGSLYNTLLVIGPEGVLYRHRKLMPTMHERVFHGVGAGDDLGVVELPGSGRVGGLICWENRMPLARWHVYEGGPQIWLAPTADDSDGWIASMRHIAIEAGAFVVSAPQFIPASAFPADFPLALPDGVEVFGRGGACIVSPVGEVIAGPVYDAEAIVIADCDLREALHAKRYFDVAGHYGRADVLGRPTLPPSEDESPFACPDRERRRRSPAVHALEDLERQVRQSGRIRRQVELVGEVALVRTVHPADRLPFEYALGRHDPLRVEVLGWEVDGDEIVGDLTTELNDLACRILKISESMNRPPAECREGCFEAAVPLRVSRHASVRQRGLRPSRSESNRGCCPRSSPSARDPAPAPQTRSKTSNVMCAR